MLGLVKTNDFGQVVHTHVPLMPGSRIWYQRHFD